MMSGDEGFARYCEEFLRIPEWSLQDWTLGRDDALALSQAGALPGPSPLLRGGLFFGARLSTVIGSVALRRIDQIGWDAWTGRTREAESHPRSA
jgi:hypothetical protein